MKKSLLLILILSFNFTIYAQFSGIYAPANWTATWLFVTTNGSVNTTGAPGFIVITGDNDCSGDPDQYIDYSITVPYCGTFSFDFNWQNNDASTTEESYYSINSIYNLIAINDSSGTIGPINLLANDIISFAVNSPGLDCNGAGILTISNFSAPTTTWLLNATASSFTVCTGAVVTVSAQNADVYSWSNGASGDSTTITVTSDTMVTVSGTDFGTGCVGQDTVFIDMIDCSGIESNSSLAAEIYPNPTTDYLFVKSDVQDLKFDVCDVNGKLVRNGVLLSDKSIYVQDLAPGVYIVTLSNNVSAKRIKLVKK